MDLRHHIFELAAVHTVLVQDVLLVIVRIVAEFAAGRGLLIAFLAEERPTGPVVAAPVLAHEGIVEVAEVQVFQLFLLMEGGVLIVSRVDGNEPGRILEPFVHLGQELRLEVLGREGLTVDIQAVIDMVFGPVAKSGLDESKAGILVIPLRKAAVELHMEALQLFATPVGILRVLPASAVGLGPAGFIAFHLLDVIRHSAGVARIGVSEADHGLMPAGSHLLQQLVHGRPVIDVLFLAHVVVQHIGELQLHIFFLDSAARIPQHDTCHRLHVRNLRFEGDTDGGFHRSGIRLRFRRGAGNGVRRRLFHAGARTQDQGQKKQSLHTLTPG